ncbi:uncharacterized protein Z518_06762 [Rhinocladiella mackenziei CBS 650.93]|uniref:Phosphoglycerate mutase family protein n=1 Tax=Rhinocladiella mackenziei CBS 650.93 TaxID=1442369 RepID=A0A0D2J2P2_9EURO|nr:uncharacterized protein Z518_06762 [Rhinocladiella mackenziei CBS 650.93]KIX03210.1 hypothetical protein Z518_06762 [Rhinocladiella mackenziei CBS 650.93]
MRKQPAVVIIARHGARLDQADRNWHTTAEHPYDPPLSYGGWIQCQALGLRISNELHQLDKQNDDSSQDGPRKKRKVIIHTSPYLRCVQTAIAISAGIQHPQNHTRLRMRSRRRSSRSTISPSEEVPEATTESPEADQSTLQRATRNELHNTNCLGYNTCLLRIDAVLGEWLSPSYFEHSSRPPPSADLVSEAKASLLKPQEEIVGADLSASVNYDMPPVNGEEKESEPSATPPAHEMTGLKAMAAVGHSLPKRPRNLSFGAELANGGRLLNKAIHRQPVGYNPPIPMYAIGPSDKIPPGYVAHARDLSADVDQDWDSQKEPLNWGDGGPFDEEWGSMHRRFRNGLQKMIAYYETQAAAKESPSPETEADEDIVLILVTHQAGCNALIRLLTGAPALHDVGPASLTLAVRKQDPPNSLTPMSPTRRRGSLDLAISDDYEMKIVASTEHLRASSNPLGWNSPRPGQSPVFASRRAVAAESPEGFSLGESLSGRVSSTLMAARSVSQRSFAADAANLTEPPTGLWRRGSRYSRDEAADSSDAGITSSARSGATSDSISEELWGASSSGSKADSHLLLPVRSASQRGLWGGESIKRERSPGKRRWTAVERSP